MRWRAGLPIALVVVALLATQALDASSRVVAREQTAVVASKPHDEYLTHCRAVGVSGAESRGGCAVKVFAPRVRFTVLTPLGTIPFATCGVSLKLRFGGSGRVAVDDVGITSFKGPCADAVTCLGPAREDGDPRAPWPGAVRGDGNGALHVVVDACLDTCIGRFQGPLALGLERAERSWRLRASEAPIGESGFVVDGEWSFPGEALDLRELPVAGPAP
jgi:hypothetical protein